MKEKRVITKKLRLRRITRFEYKIHHWFKGVDSFLNVILVFEPKITSVRMDLQFYDGNKWENTS